MEPCTPRYRRRSKHILVAVDPGKIKAGVAVWVVHQSQCELLAAATVQHPRDLVSEVLRYVDTIDTKLPRMWVTERMQRYTAKVARDTALDSLESFVAEMRRQTSGRWIQYTARTWKGQIPKTPHHHRIRRLLTSAEQATCGAYQHDKIDAVGLGLYTLGRSRKGGVAP